mmetsp:Transcript_27712/g.65817  ORF Transcript_27712/g.65817 Transcript_27712/m.65817 type:complete len:197 (-) Transcript_27712:6-596(-)
MILASRAQTKYFEKLAEEISRNGTTKMLLLTNHNIVGYGLRLLRAFRNGVEEGLGVEFQGGDSPSSGFLAILLMLQLCTKPRIYGFSFGESSKQTRRYHYFNHFNDRSRNSAYRGHTYKNEGLLLKALHVQGIACIEPAPEGLGSCGGRLRRRLAKEGFPTAPQWAEGGTGLAQLVAEAAEETKPRHRKGRPLPTT